MDDALNPRLERDGAGTQVLRLNGRFGLAWTSVAEGLAASDYTMTDLNRSTGTYYVTIFDPTAVQPEKSFWQWLTNSDELGAEVDYLLKMNRSRLGVYLSLQKDLETLADDALAVNFLTDLQKILVK
jgi:outer membrane protein assembly factor BamC